MTTTKKEKHKICVYIDENMAARVKALPRSINMSEKLRGKIDEILAAYEKKNEMMSL